jgi:L-threonylcarbamoyladenylate synthase
VSTVLDVGEGTDATPGVDAAVEAIARGDLVVMPTDTVYGIAADAFSPAAVQRLLAAKGRGRDMPVPVLVGAWRTLDGLTETVPEQARALVERFWPGPLTLVVRAAPSLSWDLGETRGTVAVRMPLHPVALAVLERTGPLAVSSANRSGQAPPADAAAARWQLGESVAVYLDGGPTGEAVPSTIVDLTGDAPRVLRAGALPVSELAEVLPDLPPSG